MRRTKHDKHPSVCLFVIPDGAMTLEAGRPATRKEVAAVQQALRAGDQPGITLWVPIFGSYTITRIRKPTKAEIMRWTR